jgi:hypothetical protein
LTLQRPQQVLDALQLAVDRVDSQALSLTAADGAAFGGQGTVDRLAPRGETKELTRYRLTRERWADRPRQPMTILGLEGCLQLFGAGPPTG